MSASRQPAIRSNVSDVRLELHTRAMDNLRFIRETMERSTSFTAVPGWGTVGMGMVAFAGAYAASQVETREAWLFLWMATAALGTFCGLSAMAIKARRVKESLIAGAGRRFALGMAPPLLAGVALTGVFYRGELYDLMPGLWLMLYGVGVIAGGAFSVRIVPVMGVCFMALGVTSFLTPMAWSNAWMALGFGLLHTIFGLIIARKHGG